LITPHFGLDPESDTFFGFVVIFVAGLMDPEPDVFPWNAADQR
jgi:hypothetical protein